MDRTRTSFAPKATSWSMTVAIQFFCTITLTATQPSMSRALVVGARLPGVMLTAVSR